MHRHRLLKIFMALLAGVCLCAGAAHALTAGADQSELTLGGEPVKGALYRRWDAADLAAQPPIVGNRGSAPLEALITVTGVPLTPEPAGGTPTLPATFGHHFRAFSTTSSVFRPASSRLLCSRT